MRLRVDEKILLPLEWTCFEFPSLNHLPKPVGTRPILRAKAADMMFSSAPVSAIAGILQSFA